MPKVSVVMPCYNEEKNIEKAIKSILKQSFQDYELIIVDDCSTDNSVEIIKRFDSNKIRIIKKDKNTGVSDSLNIGIKQSKSDIIARMDADDISLKKRLEEQYNFLKNNSDYILVGSWGYLIKNNKLYEVKTPTSFKEIKKKMIKDNPFIHTSVMFRKEPFNRSGGYRNIKGFEDYDLWLRMVDYGKYHNIPKILVTRFDYNNFETKKTWERIDKRYIYINKLKFQIKAYRKFKGIKGLYYILLTIMKIMYISLFKYVKNK